MLHALTLHQPTASRKEPSTRRLKRQEEVILDACVVCATPCAHCTSVSLMLPPLSSFAIAILLHLNRLALSCIRLTRGCLLRRSFAFTPTTIAITATPSPTSYQAVWMQAMLGSPSAAEICRGKMQQRIETLVDRPSLDPLTKLLPPDMRQLRQRWNS